MCRKAISSLRCDIDVGIREFLQRSVSCLIKECSGGSGGEGGQGKGKKELPEVRPISAAAQFFFSKSSFSQKVLFLKSSTISARAEVSVLRMFTTEASE